MNTTRRMIFAATGALLCALAPNALAYDVLPAAYDVTDLDVPPAALDYKADDLEGSMQQSSGAVSCGPVSGSGGADIQLTEVDLFWTWDNRYATGDLPNLVVFFFFSGGNSQIDMSGYYNSVWDVDVWSGPGDACDLEVGGVWSDVTSFNMNVENMPPWMERIWIDCVRRQVNDNIDDAIWGLLEDPNAGLELAVAKDCARFLSISPINSRGNITLAPGGAKPVSIALRNSGEATWQTGTSTKLGLVGDSASECYSLTQTNRWQLSAPVSPGGSADFTITLYADNQWGVTDCQFQMVRDVPSNGSGQHWFGEIVDVRVQHFPVLAPARRD